MHGHMNVKYSISFEVIKNGKRAMNVTLYVHTRS